MNYNDKNNPIVPYYHYTSKIFDNNNINIYYNYHYIKFDSDEGIFFQNFKTYNAIGFSDLDYIYGNNYDSDFLFIGFIFNINKFNYDIYIRKYQKLQSLLADIMSIINLSVKIGKFIAQILLNKVMVRDILINIIDNNYNKKKNTTSNDYKIKKKLNNSDTKEKNKFNLKQTNIKSNISDIEKINKSNINNLNLSRHKTNTKIRALKSINCFQFIKSLFCYEDIKSKLINICFNLIYDQMCIDNILKRIFILEKHCKSLSNFNMFASKYKNIKYFISKIDKEEDKKIKDKIKKEKIIEAFNNFNY